MNNLLAEGKKKFSRKEAKTAKQFIGLKSIFFLSVLRGSA
jgi:hypothetical protein